MTPTSSNDHVSLSDCVTLTAWHVTWQNHLPDATAGLCNTRNLSWHLLADLLARQTHLPKATSLHPSAVPSWYWRELQKPALTLRLASASYSHLIRAPNSRSGGHEFESPMRQELGALAKSGRTPFFSGLSTVMTPTWSHDHVSLSGCLTLAAWHVTGRITCLTLQQGCVTLAAWHITGRLTCSAGSLAQRHFSTPKCSTIVVLERAIEAPTSIG